MPRLLITTAHTEPHPWISRQGCAIPHAALKTHKARQAADRLACGSLWINTGLVFTREDGTLVRPSSVSAHFRADDQGGGPAEDQAA